MKDSVLIETHCNLTYNEIMLSNKLQKEKNIILSQCNHPSLIKLPPVDKKHSHQDNHTLSQLKSQKLRFLNSNKKKVLYQRTERTVSELESRYSIPPKNDINQMEQIEAKMQKILNQKMLFNSRQYPCESDNFEEMILQNKQLLKIQRRQRASAFQRNQQKDNYNSITKPKLKNKNKNILQHDHLGRINCQIRGKHSFRKDPQEKNSSQQMPYQKHKSEKSSHSNSTINMDLDKKVQKLKSNNLSKQIKGRYRLATQCSADYQKKNMFDNIHKYLVNQQINSKHKVNDLPDKKQKFVERKSALENQIRSIEKVIGLRGQSTTRMEQRFRIPQQKQRNQSSLNDAGACDWHRIYMESPSNNCSKKLLIRQSTFEGQIAQISNLQLRSEHLLSMCLANQQKLLDLMQFKTNSNRQNFQCKQESFSK